MGNLKFKQQLSQYAQWRKALIQSIEKYQQQCISYQLSESHSNTLLNNLNGLQSDRITLAFVAEFSSEKAELINSLFFSETEGGLFPYSSDKTIPCPSEWRYDPKDSYLRLLNIESRQEDISLMKFKQMPERWTKIELDFESPTQIQQALQTLFASKEVDKALAAKLGLWHEREVTEQAAINQEKIKIPCWRYALISLPHPLLQAGLCILDGSGLNALAIEPELALSILPSAQASIFVLAAEAGVTQKDLEIWQNYICKSSAYSRQRLAIVMNKIDVLADDFAEASEYEVAIEKQLKTVATILKLDEKVIFPVATKPALPDKVRAKNCLNALENYLTDILKQHRNLVAASINKNIVCLSTELVNSSNMKLSNAQKKLDEFKKVDFENQDMHDKLVAEIKQRQNAYMGNIENFQSSQKLFVIQVKKLVNSFAKEKIDQRINASQQNILQSLTTYGMKQNIRKLFDDLRDLLQDSINASNETARLVTTIHKKFQDEHGFKMVKTRLFSIEQYQFELEQIFIEGEMFCNSTKTAMTRQSVVVNKLHDTLITNTRKIFGHAHKDSGNWGHHALNPLIHAIKNQKKQIVNRQQILGKINASKAHATKKISTLEADLKHLKKQQSELAMIIKAIDLN